MIVFGILLTIIAGALIAGQTRIVLRAWNAQAAGWQKPVKRNENPKSFWLRFAFEIFLLIIAAWYFAGLIAVWFS